MAEQRTIQAEEIMCTGVEACSETLSLADAARVMQAHDCGIVPVTSEDGQQLRGVITDRDVCMAALAKDAPLTSVTISEAMTSDPVCAKPGDALDSVHDKMRQQQVRRLPVIDGNKLVGMVSLNDITQRAAATQGEHTEREQQEIVETLTRISAPQALRPS